MATREPRFTTFRVGWHREPTPDGTPKWWADMGGVAAGLDPNGDVP